MMERSQIREGMVVYSSDGEKLGKVLTGDTSTFIIEKGFFFPKDYVARYDQVAEVRGDDIHLSLTKDSFAASADAPRDVGDQNRGWTGAGGFSGDDRATGLRADRADDLGASRSATGPDELVRERIGVEGEDALGEDIRKHVQPGEDPGTLESTRADPDEDR